MANIVEHQEIFNFSEETEVRARALGRIFQAAEILGVTAINLNNVTLESGKKVSWRLTRKSLGSWSKEEIFHKDHK